MTKQDEMELEYLKKKLTKLKPILNKVKCKRFVLEC